MKIRHRILVVEDDSILAEMLQASIELHDPDCSALRVDTPEAAVAVLGREPVDLVVTELEFQSSKRGLDFVRALAATNEPLPFLVMTHRELHELPAELGPRLVVHKPLQMDVFLRRIDALLPSTGDSVLHGVRLASVLQFMSQDRKTCVLTVRGDRYAGRIDLREGEIVHAECGHRQGKPALMHLLSLPDPSITVAEGTRGPRTIHSPLDRLLLEWALQQDEQTACTTTPL